MMETKILTIKEAEELAVAIGFTVKTDSTGRLHIKNGSKVVAYVNQRNYGLAWAKDGSTDHVVTMEELQQKFDNPNTTPKPKSPEPEQPMSIPTPTTTDTELVPQDFFYVERKIETGNTDLEEFDNAMKQNKNVLLIGPTGSGKTALPRKFCAIKKQPYSRVSLNGGCSVEDLVGTFVLKNMETVWVDGILTQAMRNGWLLVIDEINAAPADVLFVLNSVMDDERILILSLKGGEVVQPHPNFRIVATCNPTELGYTGTNEMNEALKDRFQVIMYLDYNETVERKILKKKGIEKEKIDDIMNFVQKIRDAQKITGDGSITTPFSTRSLINLVDLMKEGKIKLILNRFKLDEQSVVSDIIDMLIEKKKPVETPKSDSMGV